MQISSRVAWRHNIEPKLGHPSSEDITFTDLGDQELTITGTIRWAGSVKAYFFKFQSIGRPGQMWVGDDVAVRADVFRALSQRLQGIYGITYAYGVYPAIVTDIGQIALVNAMPEIKSLL